MILDDLRRRRRRCATCIDNSFTAIWLDRLSDRRLASRAKQALQWHVASTPVTSIAAEKFHLLGQECRRFRSRGQPPSPHKVMNQKMIYRQSVAQHAAKKIDGVVGAVLPQPRQRNMFFRMAASKSLARLCGRKKQMVHRDLPRKRSKRSAWSAYREAHWPPDVRPGTPRAGTEHKRLRTAFRALPPAQRRQWDAIAEQPASERPPHVLGERVAAGPGMSQRGQQHSRDSAFKHALSSIMGHDAWGAGLAMDAAWTPLKPELMDDSLPMAEAKAQAGTIFEYQPTAEVNPPGTAQPERVCATRFGGLCACDLESAAAENLTFNLHKRLKELHAEIPALIKISSSDGSCETSFLVVDVFGRGISQQMMPAPQLPTAPSVHKLEPASTGAPGFCISSHRAFASILKRIGNATGQRLEDITDLRLTVCNFRDGGGTSLRFHVDNLQDIGPPRGQGAFLCNGQGELGEGRGVGMYFSTMLIISLAITFSFTTPFAALMWRGFGGPGTGV